MKKLLLNTKIYTKKELSNFSIIIHSDLSECRRLWQQFSRDDSLFDLWEVRYSWYRGYKYKPYFFTVYRNNQPAALLPLWLNKQFEYFEWFGGDYHEDNCFKVSDAEVLKIVTEIIPKPINLRAIEASGQIDTILPFSADLSKYTLNIENIRDSDELFSSFSKKHRYNLKYDYRKILDLKPSVEWIDKGEDMVEYINSLKALSFNRFDGREGRDISFFIPEECKSFAEFFTSQKRYKVKLLIIKIAGEIAAIDVIAQYNKRYYLFSGAAQTEKYPGIGNFLIMLELEDALKEKAALIDALQGDYSWKHRYFTEKQTLKLEIK